MRVTDKEGRSIEAISDIVRIGMITTAEVGDVIEGKTYINGEGKLETGEMINNAALDIELEPGEEKNIPQGYHNGDGIVTSKKIESNNLIYCGYIAIGRTTSLSSASAGTNPFVDWDKNNLSTSATDVGNGFVFIDSSWIGPYNNEKTVCFKFYHSGNVQIFWKHIPRT